MAEQHPRVRACVKNHNLALEVPYRFQAEMRKYRPDFIVRIQDREDGRSDDDLLNLVVEIKGYRGEDAKEKKNTMLIYWVPGVNRLKSHGRWTFAEFTDVYAMQHDFAALISAAFEQMVNSVLVRIEPRII